MKTAIRIFSTRDDWLKERKNYLGASELPALMGEHPYLTPLALSAKKLGLSPEEEETKVMRRGRLLEDDALQCVCEDNPTWDVRPNALPHLRHWADTDNCVAATPDAFVTMPDREGDGILQVKTVGYAAFRKHWLEDGITSPPLWVAIQATIEAALTGCKFAFVAALRADYGLEVDTIEVPLIHGIYERACEASEAFWAKVDNGEMFEPDFSKDGGLIKTLYGPPEGDNDVPFIDLSTDNEVRELATQYKVVGDIVRRAQEDRKETKNKMLYKMQGAPVAIVDGRIFATLKRVNRKAYSVENKSYPQLTFKNGGET